MHVTRRRRVKLTPHRSRRGSVSTAVDRWSEVERGSGARVVIGHPVSIAATDVHSGRKDKMSLARIAALCEGAIPGLNEEGGLAGSFSMPAVSSAVVGSRDLATLFPGLTAFQARLKTTTFLHHLRGILRTSFFIEPVVLPAAKTTRFRTRWQVEADDPRHASPEQCLEVARRLVVLLDPLTADPTGVTMLDSLALHSMTPYESPVTYSARPSPIHMADNFALIDPDLLRHVTGCRLLLLAKGTPNVALLKAAYSKIKVKTYLTDRAVTGAHKTNREKRWEAHPDSVQFALRSTCMHIERVLVNQLCHFEGFPEDVRIFLDEAKLLSPMDTPVKCPVTLLPMSFHEFEKVAADPKHGKSVFQVGHLDPLKLEGNVWTNGHRASNISWMSEEGNRIQGSLSLEKTQEMLRRIWNAYSAAGLL